MNRNHPYLAHHFLRDSATRFAERVAVEFKGQTLTYGALDEQSTRLSWLLHRVGVRRGDRVGIYLRKSLETVVSLFGILKAGAVYVPLDPNSPASRVAFIVANCAMRSLIGSRREVEALIAVFGDEGTPEAVVVLDGGEEGSDPRWPGVRMVRWSDLRAQDEPTSVISEGIETDLAYILYTSGSTGAPKGVMLTHRHAMTFVQWAGSTFAITSEDRLANHAPLHFDLSILDIFCAIRAGATVVLVPEGLSTFPIRLAEFIHQQAISVWYSVPSVLTLIVLHGQLQRFSFERLRTVLFAGEVFPVKYLRSLMQALPHAAFYNLYGPTETNVCTFYPVPPLSPERVHPLPIGKACANAEVFALNDRGEQISVGEEGELYVRGSLVMKGYWGDPTRTAQVVVRNPLQSDFDELVYRTGDIVTLDDDGNYLLIGRRDHMIKSRGYRIELGEIEVALYSHSAIREAAAVPIPDEQFGNRIQVFVVLDGRGALTEQEVKKYCADRLPSYMVPDRVEFRDMLPKTSTGKVDRTVLARAVWPSPN